jgi:hypothetical protein
MLHKPFPAGRRAPRRSRRRFFLTAALVAASMSPAAYFADFQRPTAAPPAETIARHEKAPERVKPPAPFDMALVDPTTALKPDALAFSHNAPLQSGFRMQLPERSADPELPVVAVEPPPPQPAPRIEVDVAEALVPEPAPVPLPVPRPADLGAPKPPAGRQQVASAATAAPAASRTAAPAPTQQDNRSFMEKLFGIQPATPPDNALSYASLDATGSVAPSARFNSVPEIGGGTAVYDIVAQVVTLPNGEKLEAHSGLGDMMDNPRYVHVRMKGATPPGTYVVTEREALFHGVRALRLTPVGGSAAIYGRDGILAHTYMLGPRGDSNGCVSFRNYDRFLQAYLRGEVKRLVVTAGRGQDLLPRVVSNRPASIRRSARAI